MNLELTFKILAAVLLGIAAFFLWMNNMDAVFVSAVAGAVCFFVSIRFQITEAKKQREMENSRDEEKTDNPESKI